MLKRNLEERISVDEALKLSWFDNVVYEIFPVTDDLSPPTQNSPDVPRRLRRIPLPSYGAFLPNRSPSASPGASPYGAFLPSISPAASPGASPALLSGSPCMQQYA